MQASLATKSRHPSAASRRAREDRGVEHDRTDQNNLVITAMLSNKRRPLWKAPVLHTPTRVLRALRQFPAKKPNKTPTPTNRAEAERRRRRQHEHRKHPSKPVHFPSDEAALPGAHVYDPPPPSPTPAPKRKQRTEIEMLGESPIIESRTRKQKTKE